MGPVDRGRHRHAPEHRVPVPARAFLLAVRSARRADVGRAKALDGHLGVRCRRGRPLPREDPWRQRSGCSCRRARLRAQPVLPPVHPASLGDTPALVRSRLAGRVRGARRAPRRLALSGPVRVRGRPRGSDQRDLADLRRDRSGGVALLRGLRPARRAGVSRVQRRGEDGRPLVRGLAVVDRGAARRRRVRRRCPQVHRDAPGYRGDLARLGGRAGPRLLVLLRERPDRALEAGGRQARGERVATRDELRRAGARSGRRHFLPLASEGVLRPVGSRRGRAGRRHAPLPGPVDRRAGAQGVHVQLVGGAGPALERPRHAACRARLCRAARRRRHGPLVPVPPCRPWHRLCAGGGGRGQQRSVSRRRRSRAELRAPGECPFVLRPGRFVPRRPGRLHACAHRTGPELRRLRLGHPFRHDLARDHDPTRGPP